VDQVSRPLQILLLATVALAACWLVFLRPAAVESTTEEVTAPAQAVTQARQAADATERAGAATDAATRDSASAAPAPQAAATPAGNAATPAAAAQPKAKVAVPAGKGPAPKARAARDPQAAVLKEMDAGKVVVLLFFDKAGADDRAARAAVRGLDRRDGKVAVHAVDMKHVGRYASVTQGVSVTQSPTTIVIAPDATARAIGGLTEPTEVDQLVRAALLDD